MQKHIGDVIDSLVTLSGPHSESLTQIRKLKKDFSLKSGVSFNFFRSISDTYYRENFHSDVLKLILDPRTPTIGNHDFIDKFIELMGEVSGKKFNSFSSDVTVLREKGRIDLLIYDDKQGVIIENKINDAPDMPNQLPRYYLYATREKNIEVVAIVYLTLEPGRTICYDYDEKHLEYVPKIKQLSIPVSAISDGSSKNLVDNFLTPIRQLFKNQTSKVYIEQYSGLLKILGGNIVTAKIDKKVIAELYSTKESVQAAIEFSDVWSKRKELLWELCIDYILKVKPEIRLSEDRDEIYLGGYPEDSFRISFHQDFSLGFHSPLKKIEKANYERFLEIIESSFVEDYWLDVSEGDHWVCRDLDIDCYDDSLTNLQTTILDKMIHLDIQVKKAKS